MGTEYPTEISMILKLVIKSWKTAEIPIRKAIYNLKCQLIND